MSAEVTGRRIHTGLRDDLDPPASSPLIAIGGGIRPCSRVFDHFLMPHPGRYCLFFRTHDIGIDRCRRDIRMPEPFLHQGQWDTRLDGAYTEGMPETLGGGITALDACRTHYLADAPVAGHSGPRPKDIRRTHPFLAPTSQGDEKIRWKRYRPKHLPAALFQTADDHMLRFEIDAVAGQ